MITEQDYLLEKLAGRLRYYIRAVNSTHPLWTRLDVNEDINLYSRSTGIEVRCETFQEWKKRNNITDI